MLQDRWLTRVLGDGLKTGFPLSHVWYTAWPCLCFLIAFFFFRRHFFNIIYWLKFRNYISIFEQFLSVFMPTLHKGSYCSSVSRSLCFSRSVCLSVDKATSAQYLLTPLLESCRIWYSGWLKREDDPHWFWGHMVKGKVKLMVFEKMLSAQ